MTAPIVPAGWQPLNDVQWMNIVNHDHAYANWGKEYAIQHAVRMTEAKLKEINAAPAIHLPSAPVLGWQSMETVPHKTLVLLAGEMDGPGDWRIKMGSFYEGRWHLIGGSWMPAYWMSLPLPPKTD